MTPSPPPARAARVEDLAWVLATVLVQASLLWAPGFLERDPEELFSAGQAWLALHGDLPWLLHMQYRPFCGGCTVHAATAMALFTALPATWLTWKIIPLLWGACGMGIGRAITRREGGVAASRIFGLLWLFPPLAFAHLSLVAWGNHFEAGVLALVAAGLALRARGGWGHLALGVVLGFSVYVSFSAGFAVLACLGFVAAGGRPRGVVAVLLGLPLGLAGWAVQWGVAGQHPFQTIYEAGESIPDPLRLPAELWTLLAPRQLASLFGVPAVGLGVVTGLAAAAAIGAAVALAAWRGDRLARLAAAMLGCFLGVYGLTGFSVKVAESGLMYPGGLRYAAPLYPVVFLLLAAVAGRLWSRGRRLPAALLVAPLLVAGAAGRAQVLPGVSPSAGRLGRDAVAWDHLRERLSWMVPVEGHRAGVRSTDPHTRELHAYGLAREATTAALRGASVVPLPPGCAAGLGAGDALALEGGGRPMAERLAAAARHPLGDADRECALERVVVDAIARGEAEAWVAGRLPATAGIGAGRAAGEAWALRSAGPVPRALVLPDGAPPAFAAGVGLGLGRAWGPAAVGALPDGLSPEAADAFGEGVRRGLARDWSLGR